MYIECTVVLFVVIYDVFIRLTFFFFFFFNDTATTEIYTLSLHDALPISLHESIHRTAFASRWPNELLAWICARRDRKSTRLNSSHQIISYAVFCLKKKKKKKKKKITKSKKVKKII